MGVATSQQRWALGFAVACGLIPLLFGVSLYFSWRATRADWLMSLGVAVLYGGMAAFLAGVLALLRFNWLAAGLRNLSGVRLAWTNLGTLCLLLVNFPVAGACVLGAIYYETRYTVSIENQSEQAMSQVRLFGAGADEYVGIIDPGESVDVELWFDRDGQLQLFASKATADETVIVSGYVCSGQGGDATVTLNSSGWLTVAHAER